jgi:hypothetical protein
MKMQFKVQYEDGREVTATARPRDIVQFERQYRTSFLTLNAASPLEWLYFLAWSPLHRAGQDPRAFDEFMDAVDSIETVDEDAPAPLEPGASDGSSPDSP